MKRAAIAAGMLALVFAGCGGDEGGGTSASTEEAPATTVTIKAFQFQPDPIEVDAGTTVTFVNEDATIHTVVAGTRAKPAPDTYKGKLDEGATFEQTYDKPGTYDYYCDLHSGDGMVGQVVVR